MNVEQQLKLQAWVDGELPTADAGRMGELVAKDTEAQALVAELKLSQSILRGNELPATVPDSREFYWSKIRRELKRLEKLEPKAVEPISRPASWMLGWRRFLAPVSGLALIAFVSVVSMNLFNPAPEIDRNLHLVEVENLSEHVSSISYKSQSGNMFVVYLYAKEQLSESDAELEPMEDAVFE